MKYTYEIPSDFDGKPRTDVIIRVEDDVIIPVDETNSDYQRYLNQKAEQSTPILPA